MADIMSVFIWPIRVYYEDTDSGGVVFYANYLRFMERARTEYLRSMGLEQESLRANHGIVFAVTSVQVDYLRPARLDDLLHIATEIIEKGKVRVVFAQTVTRTNGKGDDIASRQVICRGQVSVACLDAQTFKPRPLPSFIL